MKLKEVKYVNVVKYDELSVKWLYKDFMTLAMMQQYFPDEYPKGR